MRSTIVTRRSPRSRELLLAPAMKRQVASWEIEWDGRLDSIDRDATAAPLTELPELDEVGEVATGLLGDESREFLRSFEGWMKASLGAASVRELRMDCESALLWAQGKHEPERGSFINFARSVVWTKVQHFRRRHSKVALYRERRDEDWRSAAQTSEASLAEYLWASEKLMRRAQVAYPRRWHVPGMTEDDVVGELSLRLLSYVRSGGDWAPYERVGREGTFVFLDRGRRALIKRRQIFELTKTGSVPGDLVSYAPTPEEAASVASSAAYLREVFETTQSKMSATLRRWFAGMRADVAWNGDLNEARVASQLGRSRSAASRAKDAVRDAIRREMGHEWDDA